MRAKERNALNINKPTADIGNVWMGKRLPEIDILKGIAIILVVIGHTFPPFREYIYLFHIAVFLMASGYCWNSYRVSDFRKYKQFFCGKIKSLYLPYVICNGLFLILRNLFIDLNIYTDNSQFLMLTEGSQYIQ